MRCSSGPTVHASWDGRNGIQERAPGAGLTDSRQPALRGHDALREHPDRRHRPLAVAAVRFPSDRGEGFKIGKYHLRARPVPDPDRLDREISPEDEAGVREGVAAYFPEANGPTRRMVA